jgi:hypothetical protein
VDEGLFLTVNKRGLFLTVNKISGKMFWEYNVIICMFLKASLQYSLTLELVMILTIFFCEIMNLLTLDDMPPKIMP